MQRVISDEDLLRVITRRRRWRYTDLYLELMREFGCCESTARRAIQRGIAQCQLSKSGRHYHLAPPRRKPVPGSGPRRRLVPDRLLMLEIMSERNGWVAAELFDELCSRLQLEATVARRNFGYARAHGYIERTDGEWGLSERTRQLLASYGRLEGAHGYRFATFLSGKPMKRFGRWQSRDDAVTH